MFKRRSQAVGLSLIELMIAITLSTFIAAAISMIYLAAEKNHQLQQSLSQTQENARIVTQILRDNIQLAGYIGCAHLTENFPIKSYFGMQITPSNKVISLKDSLTIHRANPYSAKLSMPMQNRSVLYVSSKPEFKEGQFAVISNCFKAEIFKIDHVSLLNHATQKIVIKDVLSQDFDISSEVSLLEINTYYVHETERKNKKGEVISALYMQDINNRHIELVEGIKDMRVSVNCMQDGELKKIEGAMKDSSTVVGVNIKLNLMDVEGASIQKPWFIHIALKE